MTDYTWSPPTHPDAPEDQPIGVAADLGADLVDVHANPVWVDITFTRTGPQRLPGFVERASDTHVYVQLVHMGFSHHAWLPRSCATRRTLRPRRGD